jgi:hypothetical protein
MTKKGFLLIVALMVLLGGAFYLTPALAAGPYQAESAVVGGGAVVNSNMAGYLGTGFVNFNWSGGYAEFRNVDGGAGGSATLKLRHALGSTGSRTGRLTVNGASQNITFSPTGAWTTWAVKEVVVNLTSGTTNTIRLASTGQDLANLDQLEVVPAGPTITPTPVCEQPAPIYASIFSWPDIVPVNGLFKVNLTTTLQNPMITLYAGEDIVATCSGSCQGSGLTIVNESPTVQFASVANPFVFTLKALTAGKTSISITVQGEDTVYRYDPEAGACRPFPGPQVSAQSQVSSVDARTDCMTPSVPYASLSVTPTTLEVGRTTQVSYSSNLGQPRYTLYDGSHVIAVFGDGIDIRNESPTVRLISSNAWPLVLEAIAPGTADLKVVVYGEAFGFGDPPRCFPALSFTTIASSTVPVTVSDSVPGACSPVTSIISVPYTFDGAGVSCWQTSSLGSYINSWNVDSLTINGIEYKNRWIGPPFPPPAINGLWYISYQASFPWSHFEMK